ncbi:hypothetical protein DVA86_02605 [Streptomyces armeniacus]|uniref:Uncharacterized protein n=1 Tax=Streptomyces armeniacus TaxID=83291 RepID=A0A345XJ88_9ACTN|nr:hypothetical protein [Streptomyces armeniacus]AXK31704.1 hypothetical protein DVA86_02605 [Streptomyces armeniacus]
MRATLGAAGARVPLGVSVLACAAVLFPVPHAAAADEANPAPAPGPPWSHSGWGAASGPEASPYGWWPAHDHPGGQWDGQGADGRHGTHPDPSAPSPHPTGGGETAARHGTYPGAQPHPSGDRTGTGHHPAPVLSPGQPAAPYEPPAAPTPPPAAEAEPQAEPEAEPWSPAPVASPPERPGDGALAQREQPGYAAARRGEPVLPVLPLGAGLTSLGLGLAFLALRLRRS